MHGTVHKLIGEAAEELGKPDKLVRVEGVGCCGLGRSTLLTMLLSLLTEELVQLRESRSSP